MRKNKELTTGEREALRFYRSFAEKHGKPPTLRQLAAHMGSPYPNTAQNYIAQLEAKGFLGPRRITETRLMVTAKGKKAVP